ncbi:GNAT family N-acetyltransferase [Mycoplasmopsis primatum]|uniref:GNAT family N-acetyltransferase n=1 Tax=Mycoplasmopsis primatum TaxID=55604 RepID=UPI0004972760|nr:GNAT family N-acetyltransferase [Mycoplasmopsis primatum]
MIELTKVKTSDKEQILSFLNNDKLMNFFFIGNIQNYGLDADFMPILVHKNSEKAIDCVILIYYTTLLIYDPFCLIKTDQLLNLIKKYNITTINISNNIFRNYQLYFEGNPNIFTIHKQELAYCNKHIDGYDISQVVKANENDIENIVNSRMQIKEFADLISHYKDELENYKKAYKTGVSSPFIIKKNNKVIANALMAIQTDDVAIIGGVFCLDEFRNQGFATKTVVALTNYIIDDLNKKAMLFYHNEAAGRLYQKIGFQACGNLYTISINKENI